MASLKNLGILLILLMVSLPGEAAMMRTQSYDLWLKELEEEAVAAGISRETVHPALTEAVLDDQIIELDRKQPENTVTFDAYNRRILSHERLERGRTLLEKHGEILNAVSTQYGVPPQVIVALWGVESSFGRNTGDYTVVDSLLTLAYEGRRAEFFRKELLNTLRILDQERKASADLNGSWAGAMGQCQFMPSTYLRYAVDYDQDGKRDIWGSYPDIFASIANYLAAEGWKADQTWGREVALNNDLSAEVGLDKKRLLSEWQALGVRSLDGSNLPDKPHEASLIQPDGADGRSFLVYDNFRALMRWNRSTYFATSVGMLADRIK
ncbi:MAG: lytic murein transglycosylase [Alphaproteobacteria bacterium]